MKYVSVLLLAFTWSAAFSFISAQTPTGLVKKSASSPAATTKTDTFKVLGNCGMCRKTIESAALNAGASQASWDVETDLLTVVYDPVRTSSDAIQKAVALAGYDNAGYKAPDEAYNKLHACCHYDRTGAAGGTKSCDE